MSGSQNQNKQKQKDNIFKVLLTGGPCAGKTTLMTKVTSVLDNKGYRVFCVPEAATLLATGGTMLDTSKMELE